MMNIRFQIQYPTQFGQSLELNWLDEHHQCIGFLKLTYDRDFWWSAEQVINPDLHCFYQYRVLRTTGDVEAMDPIQIRTIPRFDSSHSSILVLQDSWPIQRPLKQIPNSKAMRILTGTDSVKMSQSRIKTKKINLRAIVPMLPPGFKLGLLGSSASLSAWDIHSPIFLKQQGSEWSCSLPMDSVREGVEYKFVWIDSHHGNVVEFESGANHVIGPLFDASPTMLCQHFPNFTNHVWKGAGINIQLSSLRSENSWGVGDLHDLRSCIDWAASSGFSLIQLLPINDTTAFQDERDSYPYASISAFALHPIFLNLPAMAVHHQLSIQGAWKEKSIKLNHLAAIDYESVINLKLRVARALFEQTNLQFLKERAYQSFFRKNREWLIPYAAFSVCRDDYGTADYDQWPGPYREADAAAIRKLTSTNHVRYAHVAFYYFLQYHLHLQLTQAVTHAHLSGIVLKGDLPIGVGRYSVETWMNPAYFHMDQQAGAPPDAFSKKGQNWQFPTYNWEAMRADGFTWWKKRFAYMEQYMDAIRIDHVLGFFRIWSIPEHAVDGRLGRFVPAVPLEENELKHLGIQSSLQRLTRPYWTEAIWKERFGKHAHWLAEHLLENGCFKPAYKTQRAIQQWLLDFPERKDCEEGLLDLLTEVILLKDENQPGRFHFRIDMLETDSYRALDLNDRKILKQAYYDYFFQRQDAIWLEAAREKLTAICKATDMLICAEDLGMVPDMVAPTLHAMEMLTLQVQRMPTQSNQMFANPTHAPYLSVVMPSTHDMSPLRAWWLEKTTNRDLFWRDQMKFKDDFPCTKESTLSTHIILQHLQSPAMWSIFLLQDIFALEPETAHPNPNAERINDPGHPHHVWNYRCHISIESLQQHKALNRHLRLLLQQTHRTMPCHLN